MCVPTGDESGLFPQSVSDSAGASGWMTDDAVASVARSVPIP